MKMSPVANGAPKSVNPNEGHTASPDKLARAKAIAAGQEPTQVQANPDPQVERAQNSIKRIKLKTQQSPDRHMRLDQPSILETSDTNPAGVTLTESQAVVEQPQNDTLASTEQAPAVSEETKPLSPQFAALAKQRREIQVAQKALEAEKAALAADRQKVLSDYIPKADIQANALKVLLEQGVTYDQLTEQILASNQENPDLVSLKAEIKALKEGLDTQTKTQTQRDVDTETQVKAQIRRTVDQLIAQGDDYEMVREAGYAPKVVDLIDKVWKAEGILLDEAEAATMIEKELLEESLKFARIKKVQSMLNPAQPQKTQPVQTDRPNTKIMRTLTNRDGVSSTSMSKRERAIAAMEGRLKA